ncbi:quinoprotein glucose dehydrogenase [Dyadobacter sp. SG02]|uniref:outer membrane protein assembly factor BamB family protein n=1 Tax=Dyadobacter sp. SG02 TaxID=1855291 RepID=UPI0008B68028|nr:PQQ-binding-like beta-propeller repeat protein [Dyadobacter sp. SG02]SEI52608.1 quinoprotein glucose dehydrogenase [Dyadobacter sp. SG02]
MGILKFKPKLHPWNRLFLWGFFFVIVLVACAAMSWNSSKPGTADRYKTWHDYGGAPDQSKYTELAQITKSNVSKLQVAWTYATEDEVVYQFNPLIVDNVMYVLAKDNSLVALDAATGKEIWIHAHLQGISARGVNYWESADRKDRRLVFQINNYLQAIDAVTGKSILSFGENGLTDLRQDLGRDPKMVTRVQSGTPGKVFGNLLILGSATGENYMSMPGDIRAYDIVSGKLAWTFHTIPHPGEYGYETWPRDAYKYIGGVNCWGEISVDARRGIAYIPLGSPTYDYYGGDRQGNNLYGNSILALDARTGKRLWHYQLVHHDLWDYDLSAAPQLITVKHNGKDIDAVAVAGKNGFLFVFDRVTGKPLWPIEERPVPASDVPGEHASPTQPFPTVLPPFGRQNMTAKDLNPYFLTDEERKHWTARIDSMGTGLYTPVSMNRETLSIPGAVGGASWGSTAADPQKGIVYIRSIDWPSVYGKVHKREQGGGAVSKDNGGQSIYAQNCQACHGADRKGGIGPELLGIGSKLDFEKFHRLVFSGKGEMPAFAHLDEPTMKKLYGFLTGETGPARPGRPAPGKLKPPVGPVVATGGAPGGLALREIDPSLMNARVQGPNSYGVPYPAGTSAPEARYFIPPGWGLGYPYLIGPPWSSIIAYDLNKGTIKWRIPVGEDRQVTALGGPRSGLLRAQRNGMIVTSTGLLFCTGKDGKFYAFDAETGRELWAGQLPAGTQGLPSTYEVNGKQYLVVAATAPLSFGRDEEGSKTQGNALRKSYVVFALP